MRPALFEISLFGHDMTVMSYTCFLALAATVAVGMGALIAHRRGLHGGRSAACLLAGLIATLVGARLIHWLTNPSSFDGVSALVSLSRSNLSVYAGLLLAIPAAVLAARKLGIDGWRLADSAAPALALAAALARMGCFLNGCCYGIPTHAPWGVTCPIGGSAHIAQITSGDVGLFDAPLPIHPTQLYEAAAAVAGGLIALWLLRRRAPDGLGFLVFALWFTSFRWLNHHFVRTPGSFDAPNWLYPALYGVIAAACCAALARLRSRTGAQRTSGSSRAQHGGTRTSGR